MSEEVHVEDVPVKKERLMSLDALRGFDMFWIVGGEHLVIAVAAYFASQVEFNGSNRGLLYFSQEMAYQMHHANIASGEFRFYDLIFPLFIFMAGVSMPYSLSSKLEKGFAKKILYWHLSRRLLLLFFFGMVYEGFLQPHGMENFRGSSVLARIAISTFFAGIIVINCSIRTQLTCIAGILIGYWAVLANLSFPGIIEGQEYHNIGRNVNTFLDWHFIPGRLYLTGNTDPEGFFSNVPAVATALFGVAAGHLLRSKELFNYRNFFYLLLAGVVCLVAGYTCSSFLPPAKWFWTSTYTLIAAGWSYVLMALFFLVIDVWKFQKWTFPLLLIGTNSILIYMAQKLLPLRSISDFFYNTLNMKSTYNSLFGFMFDDFDKHASDVFYYITYIFIELLLLYVLYRKKIFLRV